MDATKNSQLIHLVNEQVFSPSLFLLWFSLLIQLIFFLTILNQSLVLLFFLSTQLPTTNKSNSVPIKHLNASSGVHIIGSPLTLNDVFTTTEQSVFSLNLVISIIIMTKQFIPNKYFYNLMIIESCEITNTNIRYLCFYICRYKKYKQKYTELFFHRLWSILI